MLQKHWRLPVVTGGILLLLALQGGCHRKASPPANAGDKQIYTVIPAGRSLTPREERQAIDRLIAINRRFKEIVYTFREDPAGYAKALSGLIPRVKDYADLTRGIPPEGKAGILEKARTAAPGVFAFDEEFSDIVMTLYESGENVKKIYREYVETFP